MNVCVLFFLREMGSLVSSHSHCTHPRKSNSTFSSPLCLSELKLLSVCLSLLHYCTDFRLLSRLINKREVADSHVLANQRGRKRGFLFCERGRTVRYFKSQRVWVTAGCQCAVSQVMIRCLRRVSHLSGCSCRRLSCWFVISWGDLVSPGSSDWVIQSWRVHDSAVKVPEGHVKNTL